MRENLSSATNTMEQEPKEVHSTGLGKDVVTVLGSGRSGTSLLMQVLRELGMSTGDGVMVPASGSNPEGFLEDTEIVDTHKTLLEELGMSPASPLPDNWLTTQASRNARKRLRQIMQQRVKRAGQYIWGFKDPRTTSFMPLWVKLFNQPGFKPRYLLAVRDPAAVMASLREQVQRDDAINELLWLRRNIEALHNTAGNCYIVHYEDWFERPDELVRGLLTYTGLDNAFEGDVSEIVSRVVKAHLNRAPLQHQDVKINNPCVTELYDILSKCRGDNFDHASLMNSVERTRRIMTGFDVMAKSTVGQKKKVAPSDEAAKKAEITALTDENNQLLRELTSVTKDAENLRTNFYAKQHTANTPNKRPSASLSVASNQQARQVQRLSREIKAIRQSYTFKIGWVIVNAIKKPGVNTVKAPFRLAKLFLKFARSRNKG